MSSQNRISPSNVLFDGDEWIDIKPDVLEMRASETGLTLFFVAPGGGRVEVVWYGNDLTIE